MSSKHNIIKNVRQHSNTSFSLKWYYESTVVTLYLKKDEEKQRKEHFLCYIQEKKVDAP